MFRDQMAEKCETTSEKSSETFDIEISELKITGLSIIIYLHRLRTFLILLRCYI